MEHEVSVVCNSGAWGIQHLSIKAEWDKNTPIKVIKDRVYDKVYMAGYTSILGYCAIDGEGAAAFLFECKGLSDLMGAAITEHLEEIPSVQKEIDELNASEASEYKSNRLKFLKEYLADTRRWFYTAKDVLYRQGFDVDDKASQRRILDNLGFNRVDLK